MCGTYEEKCSLKQEQNLSVYQIQTHVVRQDVGRQMFNNKMSRIGIESWYTLEFDSEIWCRKENVQYQNIMHMHRIMIHTRVWLALKCTSVFLLLEAGQWLARRTAQGSPVPPWCSPHGLCALPFKKRFTCFSVYGTSNKHRTHENISPISLLDRRRKKKFKSYPNPSSGFLTILKKLGNILPHLLQLNFSSIPQQLYSWNRQFQQSFTET